MQLGIPKKKKKVVLKKFVPKGMTVKLNFVSLRDFDGIIPSFLSDFEGHTVKMIVFLALLHSYVLMFT